MQLESRSDSKALLLGRDVLLSHRRKASQGLGRLLLLCLFKNGF